jgi:hypothetical protein
MAAQNHIVNHQTAPQGGGRGPARWKTFLEMLADDFRRLRATSRVRWIRGRAPILQPEQRSVMEAAQQWHVSYSFTLDASPYAGRMGRPGWIF